MNIALNLDSPMEWGWTTLVVQMLKNLPPMWETRVQSLGRKDSLKEKMATPSSGILAWRIAWTEKPWDMTEQLTFTVTDVELAATGGLQASRLLAAGREGPGDKPNPEEQLRNFMYEWTETEFTKAKIIQGRID